ncbi:MAG: short-chain dehydrogenase [Flavobacteriaceae bacterium]|nr:MAG: short-chain dehydrogenase [Flavobacteriaceae bacterium]
MKTIIITGGTTGIGKALVEYFAKKNYSVIFTGRNTSIANEILSQLSDYQLKFYETDFSSFESVSSSANKIKDNYHNIDVLINNAGVWEMEFKETKNGIETNFAVNHLSPMLFTLKLLPNINQKSGRIVNTSSGAHRRNILDLDDIQWRNKPYDGVSTYSQSKLCNIFFTNQLAEKLADTGILVNTVHPGIVKTELFKNMNNPNWVGERTSFDGARSAIFASEDNTLVNQSKLYIYLENLDENITDMAKDLNLSKKVWDISLNYIKAYLFN